MSSREITTTEGKKCAGRCDEDIIPSGAKATVDDDGWIYHPDCYRELQRQDEEERRAAQEPSVQLETLAVYPSGSKPGVTYSVTRQGVELSCDCPGFVNRKKCRHVDEIRRTLDAAQPKETPDA